MHSRFETGHFQSITSPSNHQQSLDYFTAKTHSRRFLRSKMVNFSHLSTLPLVAMMGVLLTSQHKVTAAPAVAEAAEVTTFTVTTRFSFAKWVDSITADPSTALSPEDAVQAYLDTSTSTVNATALPGTTTAGVTEKRRRAAAEAVCEYWTGGRDRAKVCQFSLETP